MSTIAKFLPFVPNGFSTQIASATVGTTDLSVNLDTISGLPTEGIGQFFKKDANGDVVAGSVEFVHWTNASGNTLTFSDTGDRGIAGSDNGAQSYVADDYFEVWVSSYYVGGYGGTIEHNADGTHKASAVVPTSYLDTDGTLAANSDTKVATQKATKTYVDGKTPTDGWISAPYTLGYVSASSFGIAGVDLTTLFKPGTRVKFTQTTAKYFVVTSSSFSTNTTVTVAVNTDYTIANAAITSPYYSYQLSPQGYPDIFNYTPTGVSASGVTLAGHYSIVGRICKVRILATFSGGITFTTMPSLPVTVSASFQAKNNTSSPAGFGGYFDSGTSNNPGSLFPCPVASDTTVNIVGSTGTPISASSPITWANNDAFNVDLSYEI